MGKADISLALKKNRIFKKMQPWLVCLTSALFFFYDFVQMNVFSAISPGITTTFNLNATQLGNLSAAYLYSSVLVLFPIGLLLDRFSTRKLIISAMSVSVMSTALFALSPSITLSQLFRFTAGLGGAFCFLSSVMLATRWFSSKNLAFVTGLIITTAMTGGIFAQAPLILLTDHVGWRTALLCIATGGFFILLLIICLVKDHPPDSPPNTTSQHYELGFWHSIMQATINKQNWYCGWYTCLLNLPILMLGALWGNSFLVKVYALTRLEASFIVSMIFTGTIIGSVIFGWWSDYLRSRRTPMIIGALVSLVVICLVIFLPKLSYKALIGLFLALGLSTSSQVISYPAVAENNLKAFTGAAEGLTAMIIMSGGAIFQPLFGWLMDLHHKAAVREILSTYTSSDYQFAVIILPIAFIISLLLAFAIKETYPK